MVFNKLPHIIFLLSVLIIITIGYFYFFEISPTFVAKPKIENPTFIDRDLQENSTLGGNFNITSEHLIYFLNELEAYKLHNILFTSQKPVIEMYIRDTSQEFYFDVTNNKIMEMNQKAYPDIKISSTKEEILLLLENSSSDSIISAITGGKISLEVLKDEKTLALKGYKAIYDRIESTANQNEVTAKVVFKLNPLGFTNGVRVSLLMFTAIIISLILEKEL